jgi:hypothetical protein
MMIMMMIMMRMMLLVALGVNKLCLTSSHHITKVGKPSEREREEKGSIRVGISTGRSKERFFSMRFSCSF